MNKHGQHQDDFTIVSVSRDEFCVILNERHYVGHYIAGWDYTVVMYVPSEREIDAGKVSVPVGFSYGDCQSIIESCSTSDDFRSLLCVVTFADSDMVANVCDIICEAQDWDDGHYNLSGILNCF